MKTASQQITTPTPKCIQQHTAMLELKRITFSYQGRSVLKDVSLCIPKNAVTALMGASGGGKTTLLKIMSGQIRPDAGEIWFNGCDITQATQKKWHAIRREMGMLFQFGALFTDLNAFDNVAFPLREHTHLTPSMVNDVVLMKLEAVGLRGAKHLMPVNLSGGMARRVALARAMALDPQLLMYDEPFAGLDPIALGTVARLIRDIGQALGVTSVVVSHDVGETCKIADKIILLANGQIVLQGTPSEVLSSNDPTVVQFMRAQSDGPVSFHYPSLAMGQELAMPTNNVPKT